MYRKHRIAAAGGIVVALLLTGCGQSGSGSGAAPETVPQSLDAKGRSLTVWVMQDDYDQQTLDAINAEFEKRTGAKVDVQIQQWDGITTKLSTALSTNTPPDVVDIGNTQVASYAANGALLDLTKYRDALEQQQTWLTGLVEPATIDESLYAVPGFAGARAVIYNKTTWAAAGVTSPPKTWDELTSALDKLRQANTTADFSPLYVPGKFWYVGLQFVWDEGGEVATLSDEKWTGGLGSDEAQKGLSAWKDFQNAYSTEASRTLNTENPAQEQLLADGKTSAIIATNGAIGNILAANPALTADDLGTFALPGQSGSTQPVMLGGSDWGIAAKSQQKDLALIWTQVATSPAVQKDYVFGSTGWIPNSEEGIEAVQASLVDTNRGFFDAALNSRATPASPGWAAIEGANDLQTLFSSIATGKASTSDAARTFDDRVNTTLNK